MSNFNTRERKTKRVALILTIAIHMMLIGGIVMSSNDNISSKITDIVKTWTDTGDKGTNEAIANKS